MSFDKIKPEEQAKQAQKQKELDQRYKEIEKEEFSQIDKKQDIENQKKGHSSENDQILINKENVKYTMIYERQNDRFIICEQTYEYQKYYILEYDESRA